MRLPIARDEAFVCLLGLLQLAEGLLLGSDRALWFSARNESTASFMGSTADRQRRRNALECLVASGDARIHEATGARLHVFAQRLVVERDADGVLVPDVFSIAVTFAHEVEAGRDDPPLQSRQVAV